MKKYQISIAILSGFFLLASCGKDKHFPSTPDFRYQSIYPMELSPSDSVIITSSFKDKEGDIQGSVYYKAFNITNPPETPPPFAPYPVPDFPPQKNMEGSLIVILTPGIDFTVPTGVAATDSFYFELYLKDVEGHISDTIHTDTIAVHGG